VGGDIIINNLKARDINVKGSIRAEDIDARKITALDINAKRVYAKDCITAYGNIAVETMSAMDIYVYGDLHVNEEVCAYGTLYAKGDITVEGRMYLKTIKREWMKESPGIK